MRQLTFILLTLLCAAPAFGQARIMWITPPGDGDCPAYDTATNQFNPVACGGGGASAIDDLTDVTITSAISGNVLVYNGSAWVNVAVSGDATLSSAGALTISNSSVEEDDLNLTDNATGNASTSAHGLLKKLDNNSAHFMDGTGAWSTPTSVGNAIGAKAINSANQ
jgi:hypothetical protein